MKSVRQLAVFIIVGVFASYLLLPSQQEAEVMRLSADDEVPADLASELLSGDGSWSTLGVHSLAHKFVANEQFSEAIALMEGFVARQPKDVEAIKFLASLYQQTERYEAYCTALESLLALEPSLDVLHRLTDLYQMLGKQEKEFNILTRLINAGQALPRERLAYGLYLAQQQPASVTAANMLLDVFQTTPESFDMVARQIMLRQLVALARNKDALQILLSTYAAPSLSREGLAMAEWLASGVDQGLARDFVAPFTDVATDDADWFAQILKDIGASQQLEAFWALRLSDASLDDDTQKQILNGLIDIGAAARTLSVLSQKAASGEEQWLWLYQHALQEAGQSAEWPRFLAQTMQADNIMTQRLHTLATLLITESPALAAEALASTWRRAPDLLVEDYLHALERVPAESLRAEDVIELLENTAFEGERRQAVMALLVRAAPEMRSIAWLKNAATNADMAALQHLEAWLQRPGHESEWRDWSNAQVRNAALTMDSKRQYAHALLNAGFKQDALDAFKVLAEASGPDASDIQTVLYLAGPRPDAATLAWLTQQASNAQGEQQIAWLSHLLSVGAGQQVLDVTAPMTSSADPSVLLMRLGAFSDLHDEQAFMAQFSSALQEDVSMQWLEQAVRYAKAAGFSAATGILSGELCQRDSRQLDACREAGQLAFVRGDYAQARKALNAYVTGSANTADQKVVQPDAEALFYLAETYSAEGDQATASQHYEHALAVLDVSAKADMKTQRLRAYILYRTGRHQEANVAYEAVLKAYPEATEIKADYAASLLAQQSYDRALYVLE